jgi:hypothetical protein
LHSSPFLYPRAKHFFERREHTHTHQKEAFVYHTTSRVSFSILSSLASQPASQPYCIDICFFSFLLPIIDAFLPYLYFTCLSVTSLLHL